MEEREQALENERLELLQELNEWLEVPLIVLGFVWLGLLVWELGWGISPLLSSLGTLIWIIFIVDFAVKFTLAPRKLAYLRQNWLIALSLLVPALRITRIVAVARFLRTARAARGLQLFRVISSTNRGMRSLRAGMRRRGIGYLIGLTVLVTVAGAAGMYAFEREAPGGLDTFGRSLWWTAMLMTTLGSEYWPQTPEGRILAFLLALYAVAVFGYVTASLATFFIGQDAAKANEREVLVAELRADIAALRADLHALRPPNTE